MMEYSETNAVYEIKVGIYRKLNHYMEINIHVPEVKVILLPLSKVTHLYFITF